MRALLLIHIEAFTVVAAHTLTGYDPGPANRSPLALLLADLAAVAFGPAFNPEHGQV